MNGALNHLTDAHLYGLSDRVWHMFALGGPVVLILIAMSILALAITLLKLWQFSRARIGNRRTARRVLRSYRNGDPDKALSLAARSRNPVAKLLAMAIRGRSRGGVSEAMVREEVLRFGGDELERLRAYLRPLEVIASLAPLLGLFGTVLGMISAFRALELAGNQVNPAILSGGIWEALLTTAVGLAVAMPVIVVLNWFERRVDRVAHDMDSAVTQIFTQDLSSDSQGRAEPHATNRERTVPAIGN